MKSVIVIGSGFAGLSAASFLAKEGYDVTVLEKNDQLGGRARSWKKDGFTFDMGPSWYWMPDVFERYFKELGSNVEAHYELVRLDPSYRVVFGPKDYEDQSPRMKELEEMFDKLDPGSGLRLRKFLKQAEYKYNVGIKDLVFRPGRSLTEFMDMRIAKGLFQLDMLKDMRKHVNEVSSHPKLKAILEFPVLFLGALPQNTPALYSLMNYADMTLGTWYPMKGMNEIIKGMIHVAKELGVKFRTSNEVTGFKYSGNTIVGVLTNSGSFLADIVVGGADYHHIDQHISAPEFREYTPEYWNKRKMAPSSLLFYLGIEGQVPNVLHHNLFFDHELDQHAHEIYTDPKWPTKPLFYASAPSKTDVSVAPKGCENWFVMINTPADYGQDWEKITRRIKLKTTQKLSRILNKDIAPLIEEEQVLTPPMIEEQTSSHLGALYGSSSNNPMAAFLRHPNFSSKIKNLYFCGGSVHPGGGIPLCLLSAKIATDLIPEN